MKKKYAIKRRFCKDTNKFWYYPVHSYFGLIWTDFEIDTGDTYPLIGPYGLKTLQPIYRKVCFDDLEEAKAYIGKIIFESKTKEEQKELLIKYSD